MAAQAPSDIELRVENIAALFDALDPFPTPSRDLARNAEAFIVSWARELPARASLRIIIHVPAQTAQAEDASSIPDAFARHFSARAKSTLGDLHQLFRVGRLALAIGLGALAVCIVGSRIAAGVLGNTDLGRFFSEGFIIIGWVANWRPLEIFLYDWWPIHQRRRLYRRLGEAQVVLKPLASPAPQ